MKFLPSRLAATLIAVAFWAAFYTIAPTANAGVLTFGSNGFGRTGLGLSSGFTDRATPIVTTNLVGRKIVQAAAGEVHSLLLADDGSVFSFGESFQGETGLGVTTGFASIATPIVTTNVGGTQIKQVAAGNTVSLLLADDGSVFSFGANGNGQLGLGTTDGPVVVATPIVTTNLGSRKITQISAGTFHSLLLADDGSVFSMGTNVEGHTGLGTTSGVTPIATPIDTTNLGSRKITQVAAGESFSLLLADDGSVFSFGANGKGQLGLGTIGGPTTIATPIVSTNLGARKITQIAAGVQHSLLLADDGAVFSFGSNGAAQLGLGAIGGEVPVATPIDTTNLGSLKVTGASAGRAHSLILAEDGRVFSFGQNLSRQLGLGSTISVVTVPTPINTTNLGGQIATHVDAGGPFSLVLAEPALPGDYDNDGSVDAADYVMWRKSVGQTGAALAADGDQDHQVDADDYDVWRGHFGTSLGNGAHASGTTGVSTVPEPATTVFLLFATATLSFRRNRAV